MGNGKCIELRAKERGGGEACNFNCLLPFLIHNHYSMRHDPYLVIPTRFCQVSRIRPIVLLGWFNPTVVTTRPRTQLGNGNRGQDMTFDVSWTIWGNFTKKLITSNMGPSLPSHAVHDHILYSLARYPRNKYKTLDHIYYYLPHYYNLIF